MVFRVRAAAIIFNPKDELLMVLHRVPETGEQWWTLPGGGMEESEDAPSTIIREVKEECHIECTPEKLVYVREFIDLIMDTHHVELFFTAVPKSFDIKTGKDPELENQYIIEARFLSKKEIQETLITVFPEVLRDTFWQDRERGFCGHRVYLGQQIRQI